jgi:hypothetical protein
MAAIDAEARVSPFMNTLNTLKYMEKMSYASIDAEARVSPFVKNQATEKHNSNDMRTFIGIVALFFYLKLRYTFLH